jgi:hypothetical protein
MKTFLCIEHGEKFTMKAKDLETAVHEAMEAWGAEVICELRNGVPYGL